MACAKMPSLVKLIVGAIFSDEGNLIEAQKSLKKKLGPLDFQSPIMPFNQTAYYEEEMGPNLKKQFFSFQDLIYPQRLASIKLFTNRLERRLSRTEPELARKINLDPGYISSSKLVLATCKNYSHRIYLNKGIYAEVALHFQKGSFMPWPWTYPDYKSPGYIQSFNAIRKIYMQQLAGP